MKSRKLATLSVIASLLSAGAALAGETGPACDGTKKPEDVKKPPSLFQASNSGSATSS